MDLIPHEGGVGEFLFNAGLDSLASPQPQDKVRRLGVYHMVDDLCVQAV